MVIVNQQERLLSITELNEWKAISAKG